MTDPAATVEQAGPPAGRPYIVLEQDPGDRARWGFKKIVQASTVEQAIKAYAAEMGGGWEGGTFVAVPERSWAPKQITVATKTTVSFA